MDKVFDRGNWFFDPSCRAWCLTRAGYREPNMIADIALSIEDRDVESFITALDEAGWIKPRLDTRLREDDLKITHRLLDLLEKQSGMELRI